MLCECIDSCGKQNVEQPWGPTPAQQVAFQRYSRPVRGANACAAGRLPALFSDPGSCTVSLRYKGADRFCSTTVVLTACLPCHCRIVFKVIRNAHDEQTLWRPCDRLVGGVLPCLWWVTLSRKGFQRLLSSTHAVYELAAAVDTAAGCAAQQPVLSRPIVTTSQGMYMLMEPP
jgi:hypothetical protein